MDARPPGTRFEIIFSSVPKAREIPRRGRQGFAKRYNLPAPSGATRRLSRTGKTGTASQVVSGGEGARISASFSHLPGLLHLAKPPEWRIVYSA